MEISATMFCATDGRWHAVAATPDEIRVSARTRAECLKALRERVAPRTDGDAVTLVVEVRPTLAGVAEAAQVMGWDKRRVITYVDRGRFPEPIQALASGRVWDRATVERYAQEWHDRQARRRGAAGDRAARP